MPIRKEPEFYPSDFTIKNYIREFHGSPRAKLINKRNILNQADGKILEDHDQFYRDHKLLLTLFRVCYILHPLVHEEMISSIVFDLFIAYTMQLLRLLIYFLGFGSDASGTRSR